MTVTCGMWVDSFLKWEGLDRTPHRRIAMLAWVASEGSLAKWNPLATTRFMPCCTNFNSVPVRNYVSETQGLEASWATLHESGHGYRPIRRRLRRNANPWDILNAITDSAWGTHFDPDIVRSVRNHYGDYAAKPIGQ